MVESSSTEIPGSTCLPLFSNTLCSGDFLFCTKASFAWLLGVEDVVTKEEEEEEEVFFTQLVAKGCDATVAFFSLTTQLKITTRAISRHNNPTVTASNSFLLFFSLSLSISLLFFCSFVFFCVLLFLFCFQRCVFCRVYLKNTFLIFIPASFSERCGLSHSVGVTIVPSQPYCWLQFTGWISGIFFFLHLLGFVFGARQLCPFSAYACLRAPVFRVGAYETRLCGCSTNHVPSFIVPPPLPPTSGSLPKLPIYHETKKNEI